MPQADLHRTRAGNTLVCRIQTDLGAEAPLILCAPVVPRGEFGRLVPKLHIPVSFDNDTYIIVMSQMVAIPATELGPVVGTVAAWRDEIIAAVDLLVSGF
ncbi:MAG: CcdB family protein [Pseudomonadota bacterium]